MPLWNAKLTDVLLTAPDPAEAIEYWARLLNGRAGDSEIALGDGTRIRVAEGPLTGLAEIGFEAGPELIAAAAELGAEDEGAVSRVADPDGWRLRLDAVGEVAPQEVVGPTLSHCTLNSPAPPSQREWYERLTFLLSDALGEIFCWLRPNPIHHAMAFCRSERAGIHHIAVELPDSAAFIAAIDNVVDAGGALEFGPGRHMVGGNLFAYLIDRYGVRWELVAEMGRLDPDRAPGIFTAKDRSRSVNLFGPPPPASFIEQPGGPQTSVPA
jgi:catechol 2,3-dioxygenase